MLLATDVVISSIDQNTGKKNALYAGGAVSSLSDDGSFIVDSVRNESVSIKNTGDVIESILGDTFDKVSFLAISCVDGDGNPVKFDVVSGGSVIARTSMYLCVDTDNVSGDIDVTGFEAAPSVLNFVVGKRS